MYSAMGTLGHAAESSYSGPIKLSKAKPGASVVVLGAGLAGMLAAIELRNAGYKVTVLEYQNRAGGRAWTLRGGDTFTELDGTTQTVGFAKGNYLNPGPWRVPHNHHAMMDLYRRYGIELDVFNQVNHNAYVHNSKAFGGKPQRFRHIATDYRGHTAELLAKAVNQGALDTVISKEDAEKLLASLKSTGALDKDYRYVASLHTSEYRGFDVDHGGGLMPRAKASQPIGVSEVLQSNLWGQIGSGNLTEFHSTIFQPKGGMDMLPQAMAKDLGKAIQYNAKVSKIAQDEKSVTVSYTRNGVQQQVTADWCVCTIPASILALQQISYPSNDYMKPGPAVLLGAYAFDNTNAYRLASLTPKERVRLALEWGSQIHPQYKQEFLNGVSVAWHRTPWTQGCYGAWNDNLRAQHYDNMAQIDNRLVLAGEHISFIPAWQEGAVLSALDAVQRLHAKAVNV